MVQILEKGRGEITLEACRTDVNLFRHSFEPDVDLVIHSNLRDPAPHPFQRQGLTPLQFYGLGNITQEHGAAGDRGNEDLRPRPVRPVA